MRQVLLGFDLNGTPVQLVPWSTRRKQMMITNHRITQKGLENKKKKKENRTSWGEWSQPKKRWSIINKWTTIITIPDRTWILSTLYGRVVSLWIFITRGNLTSDRNISPHNMKNPIVHLSKTILFINKILHIFRNRIVRIFILIIHLMFSSFTIAFHDGKKKMISF